MMLEAGCSGTICNYKHYAQDSPLTNLWNTKNKKKISQDSVSKTNIVHVCTVLHSLLVSNTYNLLATMWIVHILVYTHVINLNPIRKCIPEPALRIVEFQLLCEELAVSPFYNYLCRAVPWLR
jgi:hypothetical protein